MKGLADIPASINGKPNIEPVRWIDEVFKHALEWVPEALPLGLRPRLPAAPVIEAPRPR